MSRGGRPNSVRATARNDRIRITMFAIVAQQPLPRRCGGLPMQIGGQWWFACCIAGTLAMAGSAFAQTQKMSGEVVRVDGAALQIRNSDGQTVAVKLGDNVRYSGRSPADPERIAPGVFLGTTAVPRPDGMLTAVEVHIFPESMRGTGEGHRPMDTPGNTMTNATVSSVGVARPANTMTNATVAQVASGSAERRLTLTYAGGEQIVVVPAGIPIVMVEPADRSQLVAGAHVIVYATRQADGALLADRITIGRNGFVPPP
jgi:hypothetical protein